MEKINFVNGQAPALNGTNLNQLQTNVENAINELIGMLYPIGSYYETSDVNFNPNTAWGGSWELDTDGTVLVSKSTVEGSKFNVDLGTVIGEEEHTLTLLEAPKTIVDTTTTVSGGATDGFIMQGSYTKTNSFNFGGGGGSHNNVQPSKIVNRWHRVA